MADPGPGSRRGRRTQRTHSQRHSSRRGAAATLVVDVSRSQEIPCEHPTRPRPTRGGPCPGRTRSSSTRGWPSTSAPCSAAGGCWASSASARRPWGSRPAAAARAAPRRRPPRPRRRRPATGEIPDETAGPYPGDGSNGPDVLEQSGIVRSDIRSSFGDSSGTAEGVPMTLELVVSDLANGGVPFEGVAVYVWHCTREGGYSMYSEGVKDQNFLRGVQIADADGAVTLHQHLPGLLRRALAAHPLRGLPGRGQHHRLHERRSPPRRSRCRRTSARPCTRQRLRVVGRQPAAVSLDSDNVFGDDGGASQLGTVTGDVSAGYTVSLAVRRRHHARPRPAAGCPGGPGAAMNLGPVEIGLIVLAVMLLFGYKKLPDASRSLGARSASSRPRSARHGRRRGERGQAGAGAPSGVTTSHVPP